MAIIFNSEVGRASRIPETVEEVMGCIAARFNIDPNDEEAIGNCQYELGWTIFDDDDIEETTLVKLWEE